MLVLLSHGFAWQDALVNVTPKTFIGWHGAGFRLFWRWKSRPGRPRISAELRALIREMALSNASWGEERIANELLLKLGIRISPRTVRKYMPKRPRRQPRGDQRWSTFVRNHASAILACDFCVVVTASFRLLYVLVVIEHQTRRIVHCNVTTHPTAAWTLQQLREAIPSDHRYRFLIHDGDGIFSPQLDGSIAHMGLPVLKTPPRSPKAKYYVSYCTSWVGLVLSGCGMGLLLGILPGVFDRRMLAQRFIEAISFAGRGVSFQTAGSAPFLDAGNRDIELLSDFLSGEHTGIAQSFIATSQAIGPAQLGDYCGMERLAGA
jgi:hypothetical protein